MNDNVNYKIHCIFDSYAAHAADSYGGHGFNVRKKRLFAGGRVWMKRECTSVRDNWKCFAVGAGSVADFGSPKTHIPQNTLSKYRQSSNVSLLHHQRDIFTSTFLFMLHSGTCTMSYQRIRLCLRTTEVCWLKLCVL